MVIACNPYGSQNHRTLATFSSIFVNPALYRIPVIWYLWTNLRTLSPFTFLGTYDLESRGRYLSTRFRVNSIHPDCGELRLTNSPTCQFTPFSRTVGFEIAKLSHSNYRDLPKSLVRMEQTTSRKNGRPHNLEAILQRSSRETILERSADETAIQFHSRSVMHVDA